MTLIASELTGSRYRPMAGTSLRMILPIANCLLGLLASLYFDFDSKFKNAIIPIFLLKWN